ncbi:hypothetical protein DXG01_015893 [Tephrocybe rancida]|nr:hypothetical protein DXG01_015893 [Tephrocybe rancida]
MGHKKKGNPKELLKQRTLFDSPKASRASSSRLPSSPIKRKRNATLSQAIASDDDSTGLGSIKFAPNKHPHGSSDEDEGVTAPKKRKTLILDSDSDNDQVKPKKRLRRKHKAAPPKAEEDEDADQPRRRKLKKKRDVALVSSDEDLVEEVEKERIIANRLRTRDKKTVFQKNLERLKRRKQGKPSESPSSSSKGEDSGSDDDTPFKGAKPSSDFDSLFDDSDSDSNFIVEDDNSVVAVLPMQFSMESHEDLDHMFKKIFQFFVHIAVRPAKERHYFMKDQLHSIREEVDELHENSQSGGFFRIAYAGGLRPPDDLDDADEICEWLDQRKVIDMEWMKIKDMMESARHLELDRKKGDDD